MWNPFSDATQGAVKGFGEAIKDAVSAFKADPTKVIELESSLQLSAQQFQSTVVSTINATMQAEAKSEHWMQWAWRPTFGFTAAGVLVNNYILLPYFKTLGIVPIDVPSEVWVMVMAVLGIAAWTRGQEKVAEAKNG